VSEQDCYLPFATGRVLGAPGLDFQTQDNYPL